MSCNIRATVRSETGCPVSVNAPARLRVDLVVHTSNDIGSPRVSGSTNALSRTVNSGSVSASFLRPPPGARTRHRRLGHALNLADPTGDRVRMHPGRLGDRLDPAPAQLLQPPHPTADDAAAHPDADATPRTFAPQTPRPAHRRP